MGGYLKSYTEPTVLMLPFNIISELSRTLALAVPPFARVGERDATGNRYYRAYFTADFVWHTALTAELAKYTMPPRNPYLAAELTIDGTLTFAPGSANSRTAKRAACRSPTSTSR